MKKKTTVVAATIVASAALLMGTYAWESISQKALNEKEEEMNPGARLHDDFNGSNKDVYVENFTDPDDGGMTIYARIRFFEYLEMGPGAGKTKKEDPAKTAVSVVDGAKFEDTSTWTLHNPYGTEDVFHDYFEWEQGGQTSYLPTFNKDKDDKTADINGTLDGKNPDDEIHYDDYVDYTDPANATVTDKEIYDHDPLEESGEVQHEVKQTEDATVLTMSEWKAQGCPKGEFWVYDTDGWAYWATGIEPGTASGCLLNGIERTSAVSDDYYYGIDVEAQFVTAGEWGYDDDGNRLYGTGGEITNDAMHLLAVASGEKYKIEITNRNNIKYLDPGNSATFKGKILFGTSVVMDDTIVWSVVDAKSDDTQINQNGNLKVGDDETSNCIIVKATSTNTPELSAMYVVYINVPDSYAVEIYTEDTIPARSVIAIAGESKNIYADVMKNGTKDKETEVIWEISGQTKAGTAIRGGNLTVAVDEPSGTMITIKATCDKDTSVTATYQVKVITPVQFIPYIEVGSEETVMIDGATWNVLAQKGDQYLLWGNDMGSNTIDGQIYCMYIWNNEDPNHANVTKYCNDYKTKLPTLTPCVQTTQMTYFENSGTASNDDKYRKTADVTYFILSQADLEGKIGSFEAKIQDYTYGTKAFVPDFVKKTPQVLRVMSEKGYIMGADTSGKCQKLAISNYRINSTIHPVCWVKIPE